MMSLVAVDYLSSPDSRLGSVTIGATALSPPLKRRESMLSMLRRQVKIWLRDMFGGAGS
jgi:hypothetical protein